ncbi:hypothetical protein K461DRAFT_282087 [Myriangium duriaei CBS 260.36]|uniref:Uncharacterized protein n=1 Tax=Myriangium duriaei CBS 260.36 TaxID=1168546 RepID=A0A9P4IRB5_9PEZI|nr:hypothetical protein K461DRAFT_282087 [Myriangium duriaei CBS 260.36]
MWSTTLLAVLSAVSGLLAVDAALPQNQKRDSTNVQCTSHLWVCNTKTCEPRQTTISTLTSTITSFLTTTTTPTVYLNPTVSLVTITSTITSYGTPTTTTSISNEGNNRRDYLAKRLPTLSATVCTAYLTHTIFPYHYITGQAVTSTGPAWSTVTKTSFVTATAPDSTTEVVSAFYSTVTARVAAVVTDKVCGPSSTTAALQRRVAPTDVLDSARALEVRDLVTHVSYSAVPTTVTATILTLSVTASAVPNNNVTINNQLWNVYNSMTLLNAVSGYLHSCLCTSSGGTCTYGSASVTCNSFDACTTMCSKIPACYGTAMIAGYCNLLNFTPLTTPDSCAATDSSNEVSAFIKRLGPNTIP